MPDEAAIGLSVLVTRPREQAAALIDALMARGADVLTLPVLDIVGRNENETESDANALPDADLTIFVSPNAVNYGIGFASGKIAAIGPATKKAIEDRGLGVDIASSEGFDSEHLLEEPELKDIANREVRIVRGNGGREALARTLAERGARVNYLEVYSRRLPDPDPNDVSAIGERWQSGTIDSVVVMSVESLRNLMTLLPGARDGFASGTVLVTPADRVIKELRSTNPDSPAVLARGPDLEAIVDAIASITEHRNR